MANAGSGITAWLFSDWDDNLLDVLLFGWIGWAALVIFIVNAVLTFFGPLKPRDSWDQNTRAVSGAIVVDKTGSESCQWLNSALNWFYLHYEKFPEFIDAWVLALNEQTVKLGGPVQLKFERVKSGSLPPKFSDVTFQAGPEDKYVVKCKVDSKDLSFAIFASQQTAEGVKLTNLAANILKLKGSLRVECFAKGSDMMAKVVFEGRPDVHIVGKPVNPYQMAVDVGGPRKEFFQLVMQQIKQKYFDHGYRHLLANKYEVVGKIFALSILQNGKIPQFLDAKTLFRSQLNEDDEICIKNLRKGMDALGIVEAVRNLPTLRHIFHQTTTRLTVKRMTYMLKPQFSDAGSNKAVSEKLVYSAFVRYLRKGASG